jgi:hypothetical protein
MQNKTTIQDLMNVNNSKPKTFWTPKENVNYSVRIIDTTVSKYEQDWIQKVIQHFIFKKLIFVQPQKAKMSCV